MEEIHILQLGQEDWNHRYELPSWAKLEHLDRFCEPPQKPYDLFFLDRPPQEEEIEPLFQAVKAYTMFVTDRAWDTRRMAYGTEGRIRWLYRSRKAKQIGERDIQQFLMQEARYYYPKPYGEKFNLRDLTIAHGFSGAVRWAGNYSVYLEGEFGRKLYQVAFWRSTIPIFPGQTLDFWLEYQKSPEVTISLCITKFSSESISDIQKQWEFDEQELKHVIQIEGGEEGGRLFASLSAKGEGSLQITALHDRYSRGSHGYFLPGGERYVAPNREEAFCYFEPGDLRPPLNVYFAGYKTLQGFEGYYMMKGMMGCPFLLVSEPRLDGGGFYMGTEEYEQMFVTMIRKAMRELGFSSDQVILSGLSMGTFGALYYGCDIRPRAIILGKPLASIGNVASNEKYLRPGGFPTSLDVLRCQCGELDHGAAERLNARLWNKFDKTDWGNTKFAVSYMIEDDYDTDAYQELLSHLRSAKAQVYGKGIHGRHNDKTGVVVDWFTMQYEKILQEDFGRKRERQ